LNGDFQRIARRNKKAFLSDHYKEIEKNNRMGKTRDLVKKISNNKGIFHAKMGTIKDRNGMDLKKQKILRRDGKNTQKNYTKKDLHVPEILILSCASSKPALLMMYFAYKLKKQGDNIQP